MSGADIFLRLWALFTIALGILVVTLGSILELGWWAVATGGAGGMLIARGYQDWRREVEWSERYQ